MSNLERTTVNLRMGDYAYIQEYAQGRGIPASLVIRFIISEFVDNSKRDPSAMDGLIDEVLIQL